MRSSPVAKALLIAGGSLTAWVGPVVAQASPGSVVIEVIDAATGVPVQGAMVRVSPVEPAGGAEGSPGMAGITGESGTLGLELESQDDHLVSVRALGYLDAAVRLASARAPGRLLVRLTPAPLSLPELTARVSPASAAGTTHHIDRRDRELSGRDLGRWVAELPGLDVRSRGPGGRTVATVRGSRAQAVEVTLDGVPLTDPLTGVADLSLISAGTLERVVAELGPGRSAGWGGTAGTVHLESRAADAGVRVGVGAGSYGRLTTDTEIGLPGRHLDVSLGFGYEGARNDFDFVNRVGRDTPTERRVNADFERWGGLGRLSFTRIPLRVVARLDAVDRGVPGRMGSVLWDQARWRERVALVGVSFGADGAGDEGSRSGSSLSLSWSGRDQEYADPRAGTDEPLRADQIVLMGTRRMAAEIDLSWRGTWARVDGEILAAPTDRLIGGVRAARVVRVGKSWLLDVALAVDLSDVGGAVSPTVGGTWIASSATRLWARAGQGYRLPTFGDLFLSPGTGALPNPDLRPERIVLDSEIGWEYVGRQVRLGATGFYRNTRDPIIWLPSVVAVWRPVNAGRLTAFGVETLISVVPREGWEASASATLQQSSLGFDDYANPLPYHPRVSGTLSVERRGAGPDVRAELEVLGVRRTNVFGPHELPAVGLLGLRAREGLRVLGFETVLEVGVSNVLDVMYERVELYPEPGRSFEFRVEVHPGRAGSLQANGADRRFSPESSDGQGAAEETGMDGSRGR